MGHLSFLRRIQRPPAPVSQADLIATINKVRSSCNLPFLSQDARLTTAARAQASWMAAHNTLTHNGEGTWAERLAAVGLHPADEEEAIARDPGSVQDVVTPWLSSPPHRAILLGPFVSIGARHDRRVAARYEKAARNCLAFVHRAPAHHGPMVRTRPAQPTQLLFTRPWPSPTRSAREESFPSCHFAISR